MFGIGGGEFIVIFIIAILFIGPEKLPSVAKSVGKGLKGLKETKDDVKNTIYDHLDKGGIKNDVVAELQQQFKTVKKEITTLSEGEISHDNNKT